MSDEGRPSGSKKSRLEEEPAVLPHAATSVRPFRWHAFLQRATTPLFLLNRHRRIVFVNRAWESLTGTTAEQARELACRRQKPASPDAGWKEVLEHALCPPPEVRDGKPGRARRLIPGVEAARRWWDVEFFPLQD